MGIEKRRNPRIRLGVNVKYKVCDSKSKPKKVLASGKMSISGIMIGASKKFEQDTILDFKITFPSTNKTINTKARVVYSVKSPKGEYPPYRCGLEFVDLKNEDRGQLGILLGQAFANLDWENMV